MGETSPVGSRFAVSIPPTIELGVTGSQQNAPPATSAKPTPGPSAMAVTDIAGGAFCHADVRVGGIETAERGTVMH